MSEASQKRKRFKFDPEVFPPLPESVLVALGDSAARHAFMGLGTDPDLFGWRYIEPAAQIAFDEWRASGCSFMLFGDWVDAIVELAIPRMIGERKHLNPVVQAELLINSDPLSDLLVKSHEIHLERVRFLNGHLPDDCLGPIDFAVVAAWRKLLNTPQSETSDRANEVGAEEPSGLLQRSREFSNLGVSGRKMLFNQKMLEWASTLNPKKEWLKKDFCHEVKCSPQDLSHWLSGREDRASKEAVRSIELALATPADRLNWAQTSQAAKVA
jgi:hypothetical protein